MDLSGPAANAEQAFILAVTPREKHKMNGSDSGILAVPRKRKAEERTT